MSIEICLGARRLTRKDKGKRQAIITLHCLHHFFNHVRKALPNIPISDASNTTRRNFWSGWSLLHVLGAKRFSCKGQQSGMHLQLNRMGVKKVMECTIIPIVPVPNSKNNAGHAKPYQPPHFCRNSANAAKNLQHNWMYIVIFIHTTITFVQNLVV